LGTVIVSVKSLSKDLKKTFKGADFKTPEGVKKFKAGLSQLGEAEKQYQNTLKQRKVILAKMVTQQTEAGKANTKLKIHAQEQAKAVNALAREEMGLTSVYQKQSKKLNDLRKKYKDMALTQGTSGKAARKLRKEITKLDTKLKKIDASVGQFQRSVGNYSKAFRGLGRVLGAAGLTLGLMGLFRVMGNGLRIIKDFDQAQADLASILGVSRKEMKALSQDAKRLGASTRFTATQVSKLQKEYAKLGFSQKQILNLTKATLELATATNTDLARAAEVVGNTLRAFSLDASETQRVVDVMAKSFNESSLDMERFSTAMGTVAPVAATAGVSLERTTALLGTLVSAGVDASTAGTGLRNMFLELAKTGLTFEEAMEQINSASNKNAAALKLFGKRGATVGNIIAKSGKQIDELEKSLKNAGGTAKKMADEQLDTLTGQTQLMTSAWEGFILALDDGDGVIARVVRGAVNLITDLLNVLTELMMSHEQITASRKESLKESGRKAELDAMNRVLSTSGKTEAELRKIIRSSSDKIEVKSAETRLDLRRKGISDLEQDLQRLALTVEAATKDELKAIERQKQSMALDGDQYQLKLKISKLKAGESSIPDVYGVGEIQKRKQLEAEFHSMDLDLQSNVDQMASRKELNAERAKSILSGRELSEIQDLVNNGKTKELRLLGQEELARRKLKNAILGEGGTATGTGKDPELTRLGELKKELKEIQEKREKALTTPEAAKSAEFQFMDKKQLALQKEIEALEKILALKKEDDSGAKQKRIDDAMARVELDEETANTLEDAKIENLEEGAEKQKAIRQEEFDDLLEELASNGVLTAELEKELRKKLKADLLAIDKEAGDIIEDKRREDLAKQISDAISLTEVIAEEAQRRLKIQEGLVGSEISLARRKVDELSRISKEGSLEARQSIALEEKRLAELERKKLVAKRKAQRIEAAVAGFKLLGDAIDKDSARPVAETVSGILKITAALQAIPQFFDGTEDTGKGGEGVDGKGGFRAVLHPHERVVDRKNNEAMQGLSNSELAEAAKLYNTGVQSDSYKAGQMPMQLVEHAYMSNAQVLKKFDKLSETMQDGNDRIAREIKKKPVPYLEYDQLKNAVMQGVIQDGKNDGVHIELGY
jgi:hypothetical protein